MAAVGHFLAIELQHHVAALEARLSGRAVRRDFAHQRAGGVLELESFASAGVTSWIITPR